MVRCRPRVRFDEPVFASHRSRSDRARATIPAFRQKLLQQSLDALLGKLQKRTPAVRPAATNAGQMREGVTLAVRLAELIQARRTTLSAALIQLAFPAGPRIRPALSARPRPGAERTAAP